jgi:hypothetical protein
MPENLNIYPVSLVLEGITRPLPSAFLQRNRQFDREPCNEPRSQLSITNWENDKIVHQTHRFLEARSYESM